MNGLTAVQLLVLSKLKMKAPELVPGDYKFDFTARFSGEDVEAGFKSAFRAKSKSVTWPV